MNPAKKRQRRRKRSGLMELLENELHQRLGERTRFIDTPKHQPKMSELLKELMLPHLEDIEDEEELEMLFTFGVMAWNIAILPVEKHPQLLAEAAEIFPAEDRQDIQGFLQVLIRDKIELFPEYTLSIVDFKVGKVKGEMKISVASLPLKKMP
ncbi:hypothetical protein GlitD10_0699 [Gloeomargarita lithophora Alchichica-D10]|uniref:Uncharacterized protein n=1 Tax=Gloeomargarita lithophora Alchichica-D10 TaxID=1188229 RepID=A0A1J0AAS5_9CYAN|nr:hypothetical protein [Gloeomargarita lithophora]APB33013.1 hypothetical protein GlitD10_0699 [Gloeomargarita lithophora Alchichica-D10]